MTRRLPVAAAALALLTPLLVSSPAQAVDFPPTPTLTGLSAVSSPVQDGEDATVSWTGDDGGLELFIVKAVYRDAAGAEHDLVDGVGDTPTTGIMRATVDSSWATGPAVPTSLTILDLGGNGRTYYPDDPRTTSVDEAKVQVFAGGSAVGYEYGGPDLFSGATIDIREVVTDTAAPELTSLSLGQSTALPGGSVTLNWAGSDDLSGVRGIRVQVRGSDGATSSVIEDYTVGPPPTSGTVQIPVPESAPDGIWQVMQVGVWDNTCKERFYLLQGPDSSPASATGDCATGTIDSGTESPSDLSIAPLAVGVIEVLPEMKAPDAPTAVAVSRTNDQWVLDWTSTHPWTDSDSLQFYDWGYQVELDGDVVGHPWPDTDTVLDESQVDAGEHTVRVRAVNRFGPGAWSDPVAFSTEPPDVVTDPIARGHLWGARTKWTPSATGDVAVRYLVLRRPGTRSINEMPTPDLTQPGVTALQYDDQALKSGRTYTYAVFAVDAENQVSVGGVTHLAGTHTRVGDVALQPRQEVVLRGRVLDLSDAGVAGIRVVVQKALGSAPTDFSKTAITATTDANGRYRLTLSPRAGVVYRVATPGGIGHGPSWSATLS